jgi:hypothetical protein
MMGSGGGLNVRGGDQLPIEIQLPITFFMIGHHNIICRLEQHVHGHMPHILFYSSVGLNSGPHLHF